MNVLRSLAHAPASGIKPQIGDTVYSVTLLTRPPGSCALSPIGNRMARDELRNGDLKLIKWFRPLVNTVNGYHLPSQWLVARTARRCSRPRAAGDTLPCWGDQSKFPQMLLLESCFGCCRERYQHDPAPSAVSHRLPPSSYKQQLQNYPKGTST